MFAVVTVVARKTRSGDISSYGGLFSYAPGIATLMTIFMASLAGIPPLGGWFGKFAAFQSLVSAGTIWAYVLAIIGGVNSVVAFGYYGSILREMWMRPVPDGDTGTNMARTLDAVVAELEGADHAMAPMNSALYCTDSVSNRAKGVVTSNAPSN